MLKHLPADDKKQEIINMVENHQVSIIVGETGSGKTTRVPQFLNEQGYHVLCSQPRRLAAISVAEYVAQEMSVKIGQEVGYATGHEKNKSSKTEILFVTDGLALVKKLLGETSDRKRVLIIDEVHEWNINIEVLVAWCKQHLDENFKLILMSATIESQKLSKYFNNAPIVTIPGRTFPVVELLSCGSPIKDICGLLQKGRNVLVFCSGKQHINEVAAEINSEVGTLGIQAEVCPLHGELTYEKQRAAFAKYNIPKVVIATNVAQTSITIEDIDAVVDFGLEKRLEVHNGIESLVEGWISTADSRQRAGRAGRCKEGFYINLVEKEMQLEFPVPEIQRANLEHTILRLAMFDFDMEEMDFFHQPYKPTIHKGKSLLRLLGLMKNNEVTPLGKEVAFLPLSPRSGKMLLACKENNEMLYDMIVGVACLEVNGITDRSNDWRSLAMFETDSDLIAQINVFKSAENIKYSDMKKQGIFVKDYKKAKEIVLKLLKIFPEAKKHSQRPDKQKMIPIIVECFKDSAFDIMWGDATAFYPEFGGKFRRKLSKQSVVRFPSYAVGVPFTIKNKDGYSIHLLTMMTKFDETLLTQYRIGYNDQDQEDGEPEQGLAFPSE